VTYNDIKPERLTMAEAVPLPATGDNERGFDRRSWIVTAAAILIVLLSLLQTIHHFSLPTDGWEMDQIEVEGEKDRIVFTYNQLGEPTPLRQGDVLVAIEGQSIEDIMDNAGYLRPQRPENWDFGRTVRYSVLRDGEQLELDVAMKGWTANQVFWRVGFNIFDQLPALLQLMIGVFVFVRRPRSQAAQLLLQLYVWFFVAVAVSGSANENNLTAMPDVFYVTAYWPAEFFYNFSLMLFMLPLWVHLLLVFPVVKAPMRRFPRLAPAALYGSMVGCIALALWWVHEDQFMTSDTGEAIVLIGLMGLLAIGVGSAIHTVFTAQDPVRRAQIRWVAWGALLSIGYLLGGFAVMLFGVPIETYFAYVPRVVFIAFPVTLAVAILRYRLFDIDILINRTLVYGILTALLAGVYFSCVVVLQRVLYMITDGGGTDLAVVGSTLAIAALFQPLRQRVQVTIDRRFYRQKYDAVQTLNQFSKRLRDEVDLQALTGDLLVVVRDTVQPANVSLWLMEPRRPVRSEVS
jgi:hypothetical protein